MTITSHTDGLSGTFYVRCSTGTLVVKEGSISNQIEVSFGDGLALKADEATPIYVVVPAGSYGAITAQLTTTDNKVMIIKFSSYGGKGFKAGTVREFGEFTFAENSTEANEEGTFEIHTVADMLKFAKIAPVFGPRSEAKLMANIDMTGVEWTPIDGFIHTFNGNNMSIKGLSAPLFGVCAAKIHDLTLTDVAIESTNDLTIGAIANHIVDGAMTNCSASGSLIYHEAISTGVSVGGLVGKINRCEFNNNTSRVNITVVGEMTTELLNDYILRVGGLTATLENPVSKVEKCNNYGAIIITDNVDRLSVGGLIGFCDAAANFDDCHNHGDMTLSANVQGSSFSLFTGVVAAIDGSFDTKNPTFTATNVSNNGNITFGAVGGESVEPTAGLTNYYTHVGAMFGYTRDIGTDYFAVKLENCRNNGNVDINCLGGKSAIKISGIFSQTATDVTLTNCHNYGKIGVTRAFTDNTVSAQIYVASFIAHSLSDVPGRNAIVSYTNCSNNGEIYIREHLKMNGMPYTGGITGYVSGTAELNISNVQNKAPLNINGTITDANIYVGSLSGYLAGEALTVSDFTNDGDIVVNATLDLVSNNTYIGGIIGHNGSKVNNKFENVINNGDISATGASNRFMYAGLVASIAYDMTLDNCSNTGNMTLENKQSFNPKHLWYGGLVACILDTDNNRTFTLNNCVNSGDITLKNTNITELLGLGGISGQMAYASNNRYYGSVVATDCTNEGDILMQNSTAGVDTAIGGIVGATNTGANNDGKTLLYNPTQKGNITVEHTGTDTSVHLDIGGLVGIFVQGEITKNAAGQRGTVSGNFEINSNNGAGPQWRCIGGIAGEIRGAGKISDIDIVASGNNAMSIHLSTMGGNQFSGGVVGYCPGSPEISNITNNMPINATAVTATKGTIYSAGIAGYIPTGKTPSFNNITNNGAITTDSGNSTNGAYVSGAFGNVKGQILATNITNNGDVTSTASTKMANLLNLGGIVGQNDTAHGHYTNCTNNGNITVKKGGGSYAGLYIGGIAGGQPSADDATHTHFNCVNNGDITIEEGIVSTGNIRLGGCLAWVKGGFCDKLKNTGDIYMHANTSGTARQILLGGVLGYDASALETNCLGENGGYINTGNIVVTGGTPGSTNAFATTIGGISGTQNGGLHNAINTGNITFTGDYGSANSSIGGIVGYGSGQGIISNCKQFGDITTYPATDPSDTKYSAVTGVITGSTRVETVGSSGVARTAIVRNCQLGGTLCSSVEKVFTEAEDGSGDQIETTQKKQIVLDASNYFSYIYRNTTTWPAGSDYDGCTPLTEAPTLPW